MKNFSIILAIVILILLGFYYFNGEEIHKKRELITELAPLKCDLNTSACEIKFHDKTVIFDFDKKPLKPLEETRISIKNLGDIKNLNAKLYGLNMYMGDIISEFDKNGDEYISTIVFSVCTESIMRYRLELLSGKKSLGIYVDFDVRR